METDKNRGSNQLDFDKSLEIPAPPKFKELLSDPILSQEMPKDFNIEEEEAHLLELWKKYPKFYAYRFERFVNAGGQGMVFKVFSTLDNTYYALKVIRKIILKKEFATEPGIAKSLSPLKEKDLLRLKHISHPYIVRYIDSISGDVGVIAVITSFIDNPKPINLFFLDRLSKHPKGIQPFSPDRLDFACSYLISRFFEICSAISYMHRSGFFHFDIKPANILISNNTAYLTDLDTCMHLSHFVDDSPIRVHFTWTYAHIDLTSMLRNPKEITGHGLKATSDVSKKDKIDKFDLYALGRTMQHCLAILYNEFGERSFASYGFRFLHIIACLLLDGKNALLSEEEPSQVKDGILFVNDTAMGYHPSIYSKHRITSASELEDKIVRYRKEQTWFDITPELNPWQPNIINIGTGVAPFTGRVAEVFNHPCLQRLKSEYQLSWIKELYPGATHMRWAHAVGVFSATVNYYNALISDPEVPALRILIKPEDLSNAFIAAIIHDIGQTAFAHDFESAIHDVFSHEKVIIRLLDDDYWGKPTLRQKIKQYWPEVDIERVLMILRVNKSGSENQDSSRAANLLPIDGVAQDIINGPIDADKYDYLQRDGSACGVPYGMGIDARRFFRAISVGQTEEKGLYKLGLAFKAKGSPAIESLLLARYQMYGAVYWHHTFRCIQAMFVHAIASSFSSFEHGKKLMAGGQSYDKETIKEIYYNWVVCSKTTDYCRKNIKNAGQFFDVRTPEILEKERAFQFVWILSNLKNKRLIERIACRHIYKRIYEVKMGDLGARGDYSAFKADLMPLKRLAISENLEAAFINSINKKMSEQAGQVPTDSTKKARERLQSFSIKDVPRVIVDFPIKGVPDERNFPPEIGDPARKYFSGILIEEKDKKNIFYLVKDLQVRIASIRIYVAPELQELIIRYLDQKDVVACVKGYISNL